MGMGLRSAALRAAVGDIDIRQRIGKARGAFAKLRPMWRSKNYSRRTKIKIYQACVLSLLLYGSECWRMTVHDLKKLQSFHTSCLRKFLHIDRTATHEYCSHTETMELESPLLSSLVAELRPKLTVACGQIANVLSCIAQRPLCHLIMAFDQITNFPSYVARRLLSHLIITCDQNTALSSDEARICVKHLHGVDDIRADGAIEYNRTIVQSSKCGTGSILLYNVTKSRRAQSSVQTSINDTHNNYDSKLIKRYERDVRVVAGKNGDRSCSVAMISTNAEKSQAVKKQKATGNETENHLEFLFVELLNCLEERNTEVDLKNY
ncbi:hypothetical protein ACROYT_G021995 [Oculina patagonica]